MEHADRLVGHALLPVVELLALPASIVATAVVLFVGAIALQSLRFIGALVAFGSDALYSIAGVSFPVIPVWNDIVHAGVVLATVVALLSFGALVVSLYQRVFETFDEIQPETAVLVPLLGISPAVYGLVSTGTLSLPWWAFAFTALWAHALAYRTIAIEGSLNGDRRRSLLVGSVLAIPAIGTEVLLIADRVGPSGVFSVPGHAGVLELAPATFVAVSTIGLPFDRSLLVFVPLGVTLVYGLRRAYYMRDSLGHMRRSLQRPSLDALPFLPSKSSGVSDSSDPWIPTSPSPGSGPRRETNRGATGSGDARGSTDDQESSVAREGSETDPNDDSSASDHFQNTQIFTGSFEAADSGNSENTGDSCLNCGGAIDASDDVEFCPHCGANR